MKYRKKFTVCSLIGLIISINSCSENKSSFQFLSSAELDFPSASAIEIYNNKLYIFGDDAPYLLVLNTAYQKIDSIHFWPTSGRISKEEKHDIESSFIKKQNNKLLMWGIGSMSTENRRSAFTYSPDSNSLLGNIYLFAKDFVFPKIKTLNIEGSCAIDDQFVFANRANLTDSINYLIFFSTKDSMAVKPILLPKGKIPVGISGLYYVKEKDLLLLTASEEETKDAVSDGAIGESYLGVIKDFSKKINDRQFQPDLFIKLAGINGAFAKQKVESVCAEGEKKNELILHLVADNDHGKSRIFKVRFTL